MSGLKGFLPILFVLFFLTGCLDKQGYIDGEFELDGFIYEVNAPDISIVESRAGFANDANVVFQVHTGSGKINCESLTHFVITTSSAKPSLGSFTDTCTTAGIQTKTINAGADSPKTYYIWAKNNQNKVSAPKSVSFTLDTTLPTLNFTDIGAGPFRGGSFTPLSLNAGDLNGIESFYFQYAQDGASFSTVANLATGATNSAFLFPSLDNTTNVLRVVAVDNAGNSRVVDSSTFEIDSTPPTININNLSTILQGGDGESVTFSSSDLNGIASSSLLFAQDGASYATESLNPTSPYAWTVPLIDVPGATMRYVATDSVGNTATATTAPFIIDSTAPALSLNNLPSVIKGGTNENIAFSNSDTNGIASISLDYAADGVTFGTNLTTLNTSPFVWNVPVVDTTGSKVRLTVTDNAGNVSVVTSAAFNIDSSAPSLTLADMAGVIRGGINNTVNFTATDANGVASKTLQYAADGVTFVDISTTPTSPFTWPTPTDDTTASKLKLIAVDSVGNSTSITNSAFKVDSTAPAASLADLAPVLKGGVSTNVTFSNSDANGVGSISLAYAADGTNFSTVLTTVNTSPYSWAVPSVDTTASKLRLTVIDSVGNQTVVTNAAFNIDSTGPTITLANLPAVIKGGTNENVVFTNSDTNGVASISIDYATDGVTFSTNLTTINSTPFDWSVPVVDTTGSKLKLTATDSVGNTTVVTNAAFNIDSTAPSLSLNDLATVIKGGANTSVVFSNSDANGVDSISLDYAADGTTFSSVLTTTNSSPFTWSVPLVDTTGSKLRLTVTDIVGNQAIVTNAAFNIDSTAPAATLDDLAAVIKGGANTNVTFSNSDANGISSISLEYAADGSTFSTVLTTTNTSPFSWAVPSVDTTGSKLRLTVVDEVGNTTVLINSAFNIDSTAPTVSLNDLLAVIKGGANSNVTFSATDANTVTSVSLDYAADGTTFSSVLSTTNSSPYSWSVPLVDTTGSKLRLTATDSVGNVAVVINAAFNIDSTAPALTLADLAAAIKGGGTTGVSFTNSDANGVASISLDYAADGITFGSNLTTVNTSPYSWNVPLVDTTGSKLRLTVTDVVGNQSVATNAAFNIDSTAPAATLTDLAAIIKGGTTENMSFTNSDANGVASISLDYAADGTTFSTNLTTTNTSPYAWTLPTVDTAASKLRLTVTDSVGNTTVLTSSAFKIDSTGPVVTLDDLAAVIRGGSIQSVTFTATDSNGIASKVLKYAADGTTFSTTLSTAAVSPHSWTTPVVDTTGSKLQLTVTDSVGNITVVTNAAFNLDKTPPALPSVSLASINPSNSTSILITVSDCTDRAAIFVNEGTQPLRTDAGWQTCTTAAGGITYTIAAVEGAHDLKIWAKDSVGNVTTTPSALSMTYDITPPAVTVTSPADGSYAKNSVVMSGTCEIGSNVDFSGDVASDFSISCDTGSWSQNVNFLDPLIDGNKVINVSQTDPATNTTTVVRTYINDNLPPTITRTSPGSPILTNTDTVTWIGTCEGDYIITVTGDDSGTFACSSGSWTWTTPTIVVDGTYNFSLSQTDAAGNTSTSLPLQWTRDQTPPVFTKDRASPETNNKDSIVFNGTCEGTNPITITGDASDNISCSSGSWTWTSPTVSTDATRSFTFTQTDGPGNQTVLNHSWTRDTSGPAILVDLDKELLKTNTDTVTITGTCDMSITTTTITITGADSTTTTCNAGTFSYTTASQITDASRTYSFSQTNDLSTTTTVSSQWIRETNIPTISAISKGTGVVDPSTTNFIKTNLSAASANSLVGVSHFCFLSNNTTQPLISDECWVPVNSPQVGLPVQQSLNLSDYSYLLGWQPILYTVYAFVMDEAGNMSTLTNTGAGTLGVDKYTITYDPGVPPVVSDVIAANADNTNNPPTLVETNVPAGTDVYIRWTATDNNPLPTGAITLKYTQDEISFVPITLTDPSDPANPAANFSGLDNANYGCPAVVLGAGEGCYKWTGGSPLNSSYKIQVVVKDATNIEVKSISNPLNTGNIKILAGNTESGLGGAAEAAMFYTHNSTWEIDRKTLVVTDSGDLYFADEKRGIVTIDRQDGKQKIFIPTTGSSTGDGGVATSATLIFPTRITLDYQNRLLILDRNRIRRVDLNQSPPTIERIIGGGADTTDTVADPLQVSIYSHGNAGWNHSKIPFFAMPNGDIVFMSEYGRKDTGNPNLRYRIYKSATGEVISKYVVKDGTSTDTGNYYHDILQPQAVDLSNCAVLSPNFRFDPMTSQITGIRTQMYAHANWSLCPRTDGNLAGSRYTTIYFDPATHEPMDHSVLDEWASYVAYHQVTGMDGNLYMVIHDIYVDRINFDGTHTRVLGSGTRGQCADGTAATSCNMSIDDFFVTPSGQFYFSDGGTIRTLEDGNLVTLAGQRRNYGDGVNALNARLDNPNWFAMKNDGKITYADAYFFKEFTVEGNVNVIAGNGNNASYQTLGVDAKTSGFYSHDWWEMDPVTGNIYARYYAYRTAMLNRSTGFWEQVVGGGANQYWDNDGQPGSSKNSSHHTLPIGIDDTGKVLISNMKYNSTDGHYEDFMWKLYDPGNSFMQTHVAGTNDPAKTYVGGYYGMIDGATTADNKVPYYSYTSAMSWDSVDGKWIGFNYAHNNTQGRSVWAITPGGTFNIIATLPRNVQYAYVHVRHSSKEWLYYRYGGRIYYHDLTTDTDMGALPWSMPTMYVQGYKMVYHSGRHSIIFAMNQNGLGGIAEYFLP